MRIGGFRLGHRMGIVRKSENPQRGLEKKEKNHWGISGLEELGKKKRKRSPGQVEGIPLKKMISSELL